MHFQTSFVPKYLHPLKSSKLEESVKIVIFLIRYLNKWHSACSLYTSKHIPASAIPLNLIEDGK